MRVLHLDGGRAMRGGQWQALRLAKELARTGHEVTVLAPSHSLLFDKAANAGLDVRPLNLLAVASLSRKADVVHAQDAHTHTLAALAARSPLVVSRRVAFPIGSGSASRWKYRRAAHYIAVSKFVKAVLERGGVPAEKISVVYDGVPVPENEATLGRELITIDTHDPQKGMQAAIEGARLAGVKLRLARDLEAALQGAAGFIYITHSEGLGSAVLLAMAAGVPVIASKVGGLPEIIEHGVTGWLTENAPPAIAEAIQRLISDPSAAAGIASAARNMVEERFSIDRMASQTLMVYGKVV